jgi:allantoicase
MLFLYSPLDVETVYLNGNFSPNALITPKYNILHDPEISTDNTTPTWEVANPYPDKTHDFSWEYSGGDEAPKTTGP